MISQPEHSYDLDGLLNSADLPRIVLEDIPAEWFALLPPLYPIPPGEARAADGWVYQQDARQRRGRQRQSRAIYSLPEPSGFLRRLLRRLFRR